MKQFFGVLFGGLFAVGFGIAVAYGGSLAWRSFRPHVASLGEFEIMEQTSAQTIKTDATKVSGFKRVILYTAEQEEDLVNAAAFALPAAADGKVTASAYIVKNLTRGDVAIEHNSEKIVPIASLTKLVTAVIARRFIIPDEKITITKEIVSTYGNTASLTAGEVFRAEDLYYPLLMVSSNDAAEALAQDYGREKFIRAMNDFAQAIGAYRTYFDDPSGLSEKNVSSAKDMVLILDWIRKNDPKIIELTLQKEKIIRSHVWTNPTHFLNWSSYVGGKNGYTPEADRTTASLFTLGKNKNLYAVIALGSSSRDDDMLKLLEKVKE